jgi:hypothetical protein
MRQQCLAAGSFAEEKMPKGGGVGTSRARHGPCLLLLFCKVTFYVASRLFDVVTYEF